MINREFLELAVIFLRDVLTYAVQFQLAGVLYRTRRMLKVIYTIKTWLFQSQFNKL